jgi:hypothetical protein
MRHSGSLVWSLVSSFTMLSHMQESQQQQRLSFMQLKCWTYKQFQIMPLLCQKFFTYRSSKQVWTAIYKSSFTWAYNFKRCWAIPYGKQSSILMSSFSKYHPDHRYQEQLLRAKKQYQLLLRCISLRARKEKHLVTTVARRMKPAWHRITSKQW